MGIFQLNSLVQLSNSQFINHLNPARQQATGGVGGGYLWVFFLPAVALAKMGKELINTASLRGTKQPLRDR